MNVFSEFHARVGAILRAISADGRLPGDLDFSRFTVEPPREAAHGDLATNAAMVYARDAKPHFANPRQLATEICYALARDPEVEQAEVAGPGFINIRLAPKVFETVLRSAIEAGADYGKGAPTGEKINVEYVSANPTGPMHVGHGRGAVFGDALANLLAFAGADVTREYYINDAGAQVDVLARSAHLRYREALGENIGEIPEGLYPGDYLKPVGAALASEFGRSLLGKPESEWLGLLRGKAIDAMMAMIREDLAALNIEHQVFFSERSLHEKHDGVSEIDRQLAGLEAKGLIYQGRLPPPKGQLPDDWEDREQTLFRSSDFGDDVDRPLKKSDGGYTYFASDIADHGGYVKRMAAAIKALSDGKATLDVRLCQLVKLVRGGVEVKMSKRGGTFVTLREVVDEVGVDAVRFMMLFRKNDATLEFDMARVIEQSKDNPVFYVQYAHARGKSIFRQAASVFPGADLSGAALAKAELGLLTDSGELELIRLIAQYPRQIDAAAQAREPHRLAFYLHELASAFHSHWNRGKDSPQLRFVNEESGDLSHARLALVFCLTTVLASGLSVLGVTAPDEMR